jgi:hypothetical protein
MNINSSLVINIDDANDFFLVSNLNQVESKEMHECNTMLEKHLKKLKRMFGECGY